MKFRAFLFIALLCMSTEAVGQIKLEREHRIKKSQFPENGILFMDTKIGTVKKLRYYREIDSSAILYTSKFKKDRLHYGIHFSGNGQFQKVDIIVKEIDIPQDSWDNVTSFLAKHFTKYQTKSIHQQYTVSKDRSEAATLKNAFQNLILPEMTYMILVKGKKADKYEFYKILFDAAGNLVQIKKALPSNYDHTLY
ncbi:MAG: hypothetical protein ACKVJF_03255 [Flavobacteriales bacterium]